MDLNRRRFLTWCGLAALGGLKFNTLGCGGKGFLAGTLMEAAAQGSAKPPPRPSKFLLRNDLKATARADRATGSPGQLIAFAQIADAHITLEQFKLTGYPKLEAMLDNFGQNIGFGGLDRPEIQERFDMDVLRAMVKTLNVFTPQLDFVINTGDAVDIGTQAELIGFLSEMNQLQIPWFQTIGNHDCLGLGNIPPRFLEAFTDLDFVDKREFIKMHFPQKGESSSGRAFGSRAKGFDFSPGFMGDREDFQAFYAFTAVPPIEGKLNELIQPGVRFYVLDTVGAEGSAGGTIEESQIQWISSELERYRAHLSIMVSHHPIEAIINGRDELVELLLDHPQVICLVSGHSHINSIKAFAYEDEPGRGFWEIQTSSLIDFPQEARILEIFDNGDGTGAIRTFVFNQQAGGQLGKNARASFLSAMEDGFDGIGEKQDRDVDLIFQMPGVN